MRIIIAGGTGFLGRRLIAGLDAGIHEIVVLSRNPDKYRPTLPEHVTLEPWDAETAGGWAKTVDGAGVVINLTGESIAGDRFLPGRWTKDKKRRLRDSRINSGRALVQAIEAAGNKPGLLIQSSAVGYYGPRDDEIITESSPPGDDFLATLCVEWEASTAAVETMGVRRAIIRTGLVMAPDGGPLARLLPLYKLFVGGYFGNGRQWWAWIHVDDEINAIRFLMENQEAKGPYNLTAPEPLTSRDLGKALGRAMNRPSLMPIPGFAVRLMTGEVATVVLDGQRVVPRRLEEAGFKFQFTDAEKAFRDLLAS